MAKTNKPKLFCWCDYNIPTGFGNVSKNLFSNLHKTYDVYILGVNYHGITQYDTSKAFVYPTTNDDPFGFRRFSTVIKDVEPDLVFLFQDIFHLQDAIKHVKEYSPTVPIVGYFPIDGEPYSKAWKPALMNLDHLITYTKFAKNAIFRTFPELKDHLEVDILPHGIERDTFFEKSEDEIAQLQSNFGWADKFTSIVVNRFQPRKMIPLTLRAFALFTKGYKKCKCGNWYLKSLDRCDLNGCGPEDVVEEVSGNDDSLLYLHMNNVERIMGPGPANFLQAHCLNAGLEDTDIGHSLMINGRNLYMDPVSEEELNDFYNASCLHISSAVGEGFGLSLGESASSGTTNIAPINSAIPEVLGRDTGHHLVKNAGFMNMHLDNAHLRPLAHVPDMVKALHIEYDKWIKNGRKKVINQKAIDYVKKEFNWDNIRSKFEGILKQYTI